MLYAYLTDHQAMSTVTKRHDVRQQVQMDTMESQILGSLEEFTAFARKRLGSNDLAADAVQDSLLKALGASSRMEEVGNAKAWFYKILRRTIIDLYRRQDVRARATDELERSLSAAPTPEEERALCGCLGKLLRSLKPEYAEVIQRLDLDGLSHEDAAVQLAISPTNLKVRLHRARRQLRERLVATCNVCATHGCLDCTCGATTERKC